LGVRKIERNWDPKIGGGTKKREGARNQLDESQRGYGGKGKRREVEAGEAKRGRISQIYYLVRGKGSQYSHPMQRLLRAPFQGDSKTGGSSHPIGGALRLKARRERDKLPLRNWEGESKEIAGALFRKNEKKTDQLRCKKKKKKGQENTTD